MTKAKPCVHDGCRASSNFIKKDGFCHGLRLVDVTKITPPFSGTNVSTEHRSRSLVNEESLPAGAWV